MSETISQNWRDFDDDRLMDLTFTRFYEGTKVKATVDNVEIEGVIKPITASSCFIGQEVVLNHRVSRIVLLEHP